MYLKNISNKMKKYSKMIVNMGIGDWGLGIGPNPQSPIPNPQFFLYTNLNIVLNL